MKLIYHFFKKSIKIEFTSTKSSSYINSVLAKPFKKTDFIGFFIIRPTM